ncbi:hypothetical protein ABK040_015535 [Willaertia magna]
MKKSAALAGNTYFKLLLQRSYLQPFRNYTGRRLSSLNLNINSSSNNYNEKFFTYSLHLNETASAENQDILVSHLTRWKNKARYENIINYYFLHKRGKELTNDKERELQIFYICLNALKASGRLTTMIECFEEFKSKFDDTIPVMHCNEMISGYLSSGMEDEAVTILTEMETPNPKNRRYAEPNLGTYSAFLKFYQESGDLSKAIDLFEYVHQRNLDGFDIKLNKIFFGRLFSIITKYGKMKYASNYLFIMTRYYNIKPFADIYRLLIDGFISINDIESAKFYFDKLRHHAEYKPSLVVRSAYIQMIKYYCKMGQMSVAESLIASMIEGNETLDTETANIFIDGYCQQDNIQLAINVYERLFSPDGLKPNAETFIPIIKYFLKIGNYPMANEYYNHAINCFKPKKLNAIKNNAIDKCFNQLLKGLLDAGNLQKAIELFEDMKKKGFFMSKYSYNILIHGCIKSRDIRKAVTYFELLKYHKFKPDKYSFNPLIKGLLLDGDIDKALKLVETNDFGANLYTYSLFIEYAFIKKDIGIFKKYFDIGVAYCRRTHDNGLYFFNCCIQFYVVQHNPDGAVEILELMDELGSIPDSTSYLYTAASFVTVSNARVKYYLSKIVGYNESKIDEEDLNELEQENAKDIELTLNDYKFLLEKLRDLKNTLLINQVFYQLLREGIKDVELFNILMEANFRKKEVVEHIYSQMFENEIIPTRRSEEILSACLSSRPLLTKPLVKEAVPVERNI